MIRYPFAMLVQCTGYIQEKEVEGAFFEGRNSYSTKVER